MVVNGLVLGQELASIRQTTPTLHLAVSAYHLFNLIGFRSGQHGQAAAPQREGYGITSWPFLYGIDLFSLCRHGFSLGSLVSSHPQTKSRHGRFIGNSKFSLGVCGCVNNSLFQSGLVMDLVTCPVCTVQYAVTAGNEHQPPTIREGKSIKENG